MRIRRHYEPSDSTKLYTKAGASIVPVFCLAEDERHVEQIGKKDIAAEVDSFRDSTDINVILHQLSIGDGSMAERIRNGEFATKVGSYFDSTIFPKTLEEYKKFVSNTNNVINAIPKEIRDKFNSVDDMLNASDDTLKTIFDDYYNAESKQSDDVNTDEKDGE